MMAKAKVSAPIKWHGGKFYLARRIIKLMPRHARYVEPYFGGGQVLFAKDPEGVSEIANDINGDLTNFWRVLQSEQQFARFRRVIEAVPFSQVEFEAAIETPDTEQDPVLRAVKFFIVCRQSRSGQMRSFAPISKHRSRRGMNEQVSAWLTAIEGLPQVHARLHRVLILNTDALEVIRSQDGKDVLFYCDPPYPSFTRTAKRVYAHEMTGEQHVQLLKTLASIRGKFMLSGYQNPLYLRAQEKFGWRPVTIRIPNHASGAKVKREMAETIWMNFDGHDR